MHCRKCGSEAFVKNGFVAGVQRYKCKECGFQFTRETPHGKPMKDKILALVLYLSGLSMTMIGKIIGVSTQSVMRWIKMFYDKFVENESQANIEEIEVDEMVSYINKKKDHIWIWKAIDHNTRKLIGWQCGDRSSKTLTEFFDRLNLWRAKRVYSDFYACYADVVGSQRLRQGKQHTFKIEQNNALQRHWLGRFRRRTQIVTRSLDMLNKSLALFQRFRVNGKIEELLSLLR